MELNETRKAMLEEIATLTDSEKAETIIAFKEDLLELEERIQSMECCLHVISGQVSLALYSPKNETL